MEEDKWKPGRRGARREERKHPRFLFNLPIEYSLVDSDIHQAGYTFNTSEGGLMVYLPEALEAGRLLKMKIFFSFGPDINSIEILCQVIWTDRLRGEEGYRSGVKFLKVSKKDLDKLINFLKKLTK